jgi:hypothetical protein
MAVVIIPRAMADIIPAARVPIIKEVITRTVIATTITEYIKHPVVPACVKKKSLFFLALVF